MSGKDEDLYFGEEPMQAYCLFCGYGGCPGHTASELLAAGYDTNGARIQKESPSEKEQLPQVE